MRLVAKKITLTASYAAVGSGLTNASLVVAADNSGIVYMQGDDGVTDVPVPRGVAFPLCGLELSEILLKGTPGDLAVIIGY